MMMYKNKEPELKTAFVTRDTTTTIWGFDNSSNFAFSDGSDESSDMSMAQEDDDAPPRKRARRTKSRRGAQLYPELLKNAMTASMIEDSEDDDVIDIRELPRFAKKRCRDKTPVGCVRQDVDGVDNLCTLAMSWNVNQEARITSTTNQSTSR